MVIVDATVVGGRERAVKDVRCARGRGGYGEENMWGEIVCKCVCVGRVCKCVWGVVCVYVGGENV